MKRTAMPAALAGLILLASNCGIFGGGADYWPMAAGNLWVYDWIQVTIEPGEPPDTTVFETYSQECTGEVTLANGAKAWAVIDGEGDTTYYQETGNAVLTYSYPGARPDTFLRLPLEEGSTWHDPYGTTMQVRGQEAVETPAGVFQDCWQIELYGVNIDPYQQFAWFAPDVGLVLWEERFADGLGYSDVTRVQLTHTNIE